MFGPLGIIFGLDSPVITAISVGMVISLAKMFGRDYATGAILVTVTQLIGFILGVSLIRGIIGIIPVMGGAINAGMIFTVTEVVGWTTFLILEEGKDITKVDKKSFRDYIFRGKKRADEERQKRIGFLATLPPHIRLQYDHLIGKLASPKTSDVERHATLQEIERLIEPYNPPIPKKLAEQAAAVSMASSSTDPVSPQK